MRRCVSWGKIVGFLDGQPSDGASVGKHWPCYKVAAGSANVVIVDWRVVGIRVGRRVEIKMIVKVRFLFCAAYFT